MGKAPVGVSQLAKSLNDKIITVAVCGCATSEAVKLHKNDIDAYFSILQAPISEEEAMKETIAKNNLSVTIEEIIRLIMSCQNVNA